MKGDSPGRDSDQPARRMPAHGGRAATGSRPPTFISPPNVYDQGGQERPEVDAAVVPPVPGQPGAAPLFALACNPGNFLPQLTRPRPVRTWTLTTGRVILGRPQLTVRKIIYVAVAAAATQALIVLPPYVDAAASIGQNARR